MKTEIRISNKRKYIYPKNYKFVNHQGSKIADWSSGGGWVWEMYANNTMASHQTGFTGTLSQIIPEVIVGSRYMIKIADWSFFTGAIDNLFTVNFGGTFTKIGNGLVKYFQGTATTNVLSIVPQSGTTVKIGYVEIIPLDISYGQNIDLYEDIPLALNLQVNDIRDITKRNSSYTKTIKIPASRNNNLIFNNLFDPNNDTNINEPYLHKQIYAELVYDTVLIRTGNIKLVNIIRDQYGPLEYEIQFYSELATFANVLGESNIFNNKSISDDIDVEDLNHTFEFDSLLNSWNSGDTLGYRYPLIDYIGAQNLGNQFKMKYLKPAINVSLLWDRIFDWAGFTYNDDYSFFNSAPWTNLIIPWTGAKLQSTEELLNESRKVLAHQSVIQSTNSAGNFIVNFLDEDNDDFNQWNGSLYTAQFDGKFNIKTTINYQITTNPNFAKNIRTVILKNGSLIKQTINYIPQGFLTYTGVSYTTINDVDMIIGDTISIKCYYTIGINIYGVIVNGLDKTKIEIKQTNLTDLGAFEGDTISMNRLFGDKEVKKIEFITSLIKMFNLIVDEDPLITNHLIIKPSNSYYSDGSYLDWSDKVDANKFNITRDEAYVDKNIFLTYKQSDDEYNKRYSDINYKIYGEYQHNNEIKSKETIKNELIFAPTPLGYYGISTIPVSKLYTEQGVVGSSDLEPRILLYKNIPLEVANLIWIPQPLPGSFIPSNSIHIITKDTHYHIHYLSTVFKSIPYAGHLDDPFYPSTDINFGKCNSYFWKTAGSPSGETVEGLPGYMTYHNLYYDYWKKSLYQLLDHDSKLVKFNIKLTEVDLNNFNFSDTIRVGNTSYIVNKIIDWSPNEICKIEMLKLSDNYLTFRNDNEPSPYTDIYLKENYIGIDLVKPNMSFGLWSDSGGTIESSNSDKRTLDIYTYKNSNQKTPDSNSVILGVFNILNNATNTNIIGDGNEVPPDSDNMFLFGNNNKSIII